MSLGKMRYRMTIQRNDATRTKGVKQADDWQDVETVYAELRPLSARELRIAEQNREIVTHEVMMRYRDDLGASDTEVFPRYRLSLSGRTFDVRSVENVDFRNRTTRLRVEERV